MSGEFENVPPSTTHARTSRSGASRSLISAANILKRGAGAVQAGAAAGARPRTSQRDLLYDYCNSRGKVLSTSFTAKYSYVGEGAEHVVLFDNEKRRAIKVTRPNCFGWSVASVSTMATPFEYLRRLIYQNWFFGDDVDLFGVIGAEGHLEVVTSQPWIDVDRTRAPASDDQIRNYFSDLGVFESQQAECGGMFYNPELDVLAGDAHQRNVLVSSSGQIHPIDVILGRPVGALKSKLMLERDQIIRDGPRTVTVGAKYEELRIMFRENPDI